MSEEFARGRVTIPTDVDVVPETLELFFRVFYLGEEIDDGE